MSAAQQGIPADTKYVVNLSGEAPPGGKVFITGRWLNPSLQPGPAALAVYSNVVEGVAKKMSGVVNERVRAA